MSTTTTPSTTPSLFVLIAWLVVLTPLAWGVYNTVKTSTNLFTNAPPPATASATTAATTGAAK